MTKTINKKLIILLIIPIFNLGISVNAKALDEDDKLGLFDNAPLQEFLEKPFYLFGDNKNEAIPFYLNEFVDWSHQMTYNPNYYSEIEDPLFDFKNEITAKPYLEISQTFEDKLHHQKKTTLYIQEESTKDFLRSVAEETNQDPLNGKFRIEENGNMTVLEKSQPGVEILIDKSYQNIKKEILENSEASYIALSIIKKNPEISTDNPDKYEIKTLTGTGKSDFTGSTKTRIHNIKTAAKQFDGMIIKPQEEFSFTSILGEVDETTGYKEELVIKKNKTVPEYGGGICQLSTTMFRAALNTGLKITERHNHSYPVHYYDPPGTDATVYVPKPDLKIKNNSNDYLLIQTRMDEPKKKFYIDFYSKNDLYDVELIGPEVTERTPDGKLRTTLKQVVKNQSGQEVFQDVFKSFYDNPANYPSPNELFLEKPKDWSNRQWEEYYAKFGAVIEEMKQDD